MDYAVIIPNKYLDIIKPLVNSINELIQEPRPDIIIVADGHSNDYGFRRVSYTDPLFVFSKAINIGIRAAGYKDVILLNDDCVLLEQDFFRRLHKALQVDDKIGILSPLIVGCVGNPFQRWHERNRYWSNISNGYQHQNGDGTLCFPCVILRRKMLDKIGLMDEAYAGYGRDDHDICLRARKAGWKTSVTNLLKIQHGDGSPDLDCGRGRSWSRSYMRRYAGGCPSSKEILAYLERNYLRRQKY